MNKVIMIGNLTRDVELKVLPSGIVVGNSAIVVSNKYKVGEDVKEEVCFLDFSIFGKRADILKEFTKKGDKIMLEGRLVLDSWVDGNGNVRKKHSLRVENFEFLGRKSEMEVKNEVGGGNEVNIEDIDEENIPF